MQPRLYIFAKAPYLGHVKTRLANDIGQVHAKRIYRAMVARILREMRDARWQTILYVTPQNCVGQDFGGLWPMDMPKIAQPKGDLSPRSEFLFKAKGPVICIGTDTPAMKKRYIAEGFKALKRQKAVIGPAEDGGFWLLGLNAPARKGLFAAIRWSHARTRADLERAIGAGIAYLPLLNDIDSLEDLKT